MLTCGQLDHCANQNCAVIFKTPMKIEPLMAFCPCCKQAIKDESEELDHMLEDAEDDGSFN